MPSPAPAEPDPSPSSERPAGFRSISRTKITPPLLREETLTRARLIDWLRHHTRQRLTLVIAEAGYGKTTLLADYGRRSEVPVLWFKLDHTDADWISFTNYLIAAYRELDPGFGQATLGLLDQLATADQSRDRIIDALLADVAHVDQPALLILDDYHLVDLSAGRPRDRGPPPARGAIRPIRADRQPPPTRPGPGPPDGPGPGRRVDDGRSALLAR